MKGYVLGVHNGFESGVCLIYNGEILEAVSEERFNFIKVYAGIPRLAFDYILKKYNLGVNDIEAVVYSRVTFKNNWYKYIIKIFKKFIISIIQNPLLIKVFFHRIKTELHDRKFLNEFYEWMESEGIKKNKIILLDHHKAHAWSAFSCSPFKEALIITADGRGDFKSTTVSEANFRTGLKEIDFLTSFDSIGFLYAQVTKFLGFTPHRHEGKVTGLAAYGDPNKTISVFKKIVSWNSILGHWNTNLKLYSPHNINKLKSFNKILAQYKKEDIAAGVQKHCEDLIVQYIKFWLKKLKKKEPVNICLAGGLFANVKINQKIAEINGVKNIFIFPNMGDGGLTVGGVCYKNFIDNKLTKVKFKNVYLGKNYNEKEILNSLSDNKDKITFSKMSNRSVEISKQLEENKVVGYFDGRMEFGPRALGSRSILVNAKNKSINDYLNKRLERTEFMPFAPVTPIDYASDCYLNWEDNQVASYFMTRTYDCDEKFIRDHEAVVHIDGTARPQIISPEQNLRYYDLVKTYCERNKKKALINTSFNAHEQPIIISPNLAIKCLLENRIDVLVLSDFLVKGQQKK
tara:strand:- start:391 stop:2109 length:1719 start_codon:yes stop_codon:yes gene_type:complete